MPARSLVGELEAVLSAEYPPEQRHGLPIEAIFQPGIHFFVATLDGTAGRLRRRGVVGWVRRGEADVCAASGAWAGRRA